MEFGLICNGLTFFGGRVDGAGQLGMGFGGFGCNDNIGAVTGHFQGDGLADAAGRAGDEEGASSELSVRGREGEEGGLER